jgi:hypothetical protein
MKMTRIPLRGTGEGAGAYISVREDSRRRYPYGAQVKLYYMNEYIFASRYPQCQTSRCDNITVSRNSPFGHSKVTHFADC